MLFSSRILQTWVVDTGGHVYTKSWCICALMQLQRLYRPKCPAAPPASNFEEHKPVVQYEGKSGVQRSHNYFLLPICPNMDDLQSFPSYSTILMTKTRSRDLCHV